MIKDSVADTNNTTSSSTPPESYLHNDDNVELNFAVSEDGEIQKDKVLLLICLLFFIINQFNLCNSLVMF